ncbi:DNA primase subunit pri2 [Sorochytrium milnesiophthora]
MDEDERLLPVLNNMSKQSASADQYTTRTAAGKVSASDIEKLSVHFPLCMRHLYGRLKSDAHLRHGGRMQFGLFLKGVGLPIEEALQFWRQSFHRMTDDYFQKNYAYNIRHNYGMEGKRANYTPYNCMRIITSNAPSTGDHHGCPFRHFSTDNLRQLMADAGLHDEAQLKEIADKAKAGHYQIACTRFFEVTRFAGSQKAAAAAPGGGRGAGKVEVDIIEHPNRYFEMSYKGISSIIPNGNSNVDVDQVTR